MEDQACMDVGRYKGNAYWIGLNSLPKDRPASINDLPIPLRSSISVSVSDPIGGLEWIRSAKLDYITDLRFMSYPVVESFTVSKWCELMTEFVQKANNIKHLTVDLDEDGMHGGLGRSVSFVRAVAKMRVQESVTLKGCYGPEWPRYMEKQMGVKVNEEDTLSAIQRNQQYRRNNQMLNPWDPIK